MKLLSHLSPDGDALPEPADAHRLALGVDARNEAPALAQERPPADLARHWSATGTGYRLLAAIFGNSPFLTGVAVKEWALLTRLVEQGPDTLFGDIADDVARTE